MYGLSNGMPEICPLKVFVDVGYFVAMFEKDLVCYKRNVERMSMDHTRPRSTYSTLAMCVIGKMKITFCN